jgi:hypothetical protein
MDAGRGDTQATTMAPQHVGVQPPGPEVAELHREGRHGLVEEEEEPFRTVFMLVRVAGCRATASARVRGLLPPLKHQQQLRSGQVSGEP